jgi:predicted permease
MSTLQVPALIGRTFTAEEDAPKGPNRIVISEGLWRSRFGGSRDAIGKTLDVNGLSREIIGVMPERFRFPNARTQMWLPLQLDPNALYSGGFNYPAVARLRPGISVDAVNRDLASVLPRILEAFPNLAPGIPMTMLLEQAKPRPFVVPLGEDVTGGIARTLWIVAAAAGLVLLVACANVASLQLVHGTARSKEMAVRTALGAERGTIIRQLLVENLVISIGGGLLGLAVGVAVLKLLAIAGASQLPALQNVRLDGTVLAFTAASTIVAGLMFGIMPAVRAGRVDVQSTLKEGTRSLSLSTDRSRLLQAGVVIQVALTLVLLTGAGFVRVAMSITPGSA